LGKKIATCPECGYAGEPAKPKNQKCPICGAYMFGCIRLHEIVYERVLRRKQPKESLGDAISRIMENTTFINIETDMDFKKYDQINVTVQTTLRNKLNEIRTQNGNKFSYSTVIWSVIENEYNN